MMRLLVVILFVYSFTVAAQKDELVITGRVVSCSNKTPVSYAYVKASFKDSSWVKAKSDSLGRFSLCFSKKLVTDSIVRIEVGMVSEKRVDVQCPHYNSRPEFLVQRERLKIGKETSNHILVTCLPEMVNELWSTEICFEKNLLQMKICRGDTSIESMLNEIKCILKYNPKMVMEVGGHAGFDEDNPELLAAERAKLIRTKLIELGVEENRLRENAFSDRKQQLSRENYEKNKRKYKKQDALHVNRRVVVRVIQVN